jgi:hypothetical protein
MSEGWHDGCIVDCDNGFNEGVQEGNPDGKSDG